MIQIRSLHKHYGAVHALDGLEMSVAAGTVYGFLGPNGAGKTTTLRILAGLVRPTSGEASVGGEAVGVRQHSISRSIGHLPEEPAFYPWMTPGEFLDYIGRLHGMSASTRSARTKELLGLVNLADAARRRIGGFSRGMRQRLGLACALVHDPQVLLLDEPVSALDPAGRKEVLNLIEELGGQRTVLMSSHILADVERVCTHVGIIARGRMIVQSERAELMERFALPVFDAEAESEAEAERWGQALKPFPWVTAVQLDGAKLRITVRDVARARVELLPCAVTQHVTLRRYEEVRPSLEDVFMHLVEGQQ